MRKFIFILSLILTICGTKVFADGEVNEFVVDGFEYYFGYGWIDDEISVADNSSLFILGYNGNKLVDINTLPDGKVPNGLYMHQIMDATQLSSYYNWEVHKDEYIEVNKKMQDLYTYDSNISPIVKVQKAGDEATLIEFDNQAPIIVEDRTLLPIRAIAEYFGWNVGWNPDFRKVVVENEKSKIELYIGHTDVAVYKEKAAQSFDYISLDVPALILNGSTMLPVRTVAEALSLEVGWDDNEKCVILKQ